MKLWQKVLLGLVLGVVVGFVFKDQATFITKFIKPIGTLFIDSISMIVVPLVFSTLVSSIASFDKNMSKLKRVSTKMILLFLFCIATAMLIGIFLANIIHPGIGVSLSSSYVKEPIIDLSGISTISNHNLSLIDTIVNIVPSNLFVAFASSNTIQVIIFAIFIGISIKVCNGKAEPVRNFFDAFAEVMYKFTGIIMEFAPYGVFALICWSASMFGISIFIALAKIILLVFIGCLIQIFFVYALLIKFGAKISPYKFFRLSLSPFLVAVATSSSSATLPVTMKTSVNRLGISKDISNFILPLGETIHMSGSALYQTAGAIFVAQLYGIDLSANMYLIIILTAIFSSIGTASVPGGALVSLSFVLSSVGLPIEGLALLASIDRLLDMMQTPTNVLGDIAVAFVVAKSENEIDIRVINRALGSN